MLTLLVRILVAATGLLAFTEKAFALQCAAALPLVGGATATSSAQPAGSDCLVEGESAVHISADLRSTLVRARGYVTLTFLANDGRKLWVAKRGPWMGQFAGLRVDETFPIPPDTKLVRITLHTETDRTDRTGDWRMDNLRVSPGIIATVFPTEGNVVSATVPTHWAITRKGQAKAIVRLDVLDIEGRLVDGVSGSIPAGVDTSHLILPPLTVGYYDVRSTVSSDGSSPSTQVTSMAVLPASEVPNERRFGIDAALSWYGGNAAMLSTSTRLMRMAGIGTVRDRLSWSKTQPARGSVTWGRYEEVAKIVDAAGLDQVQVFHDSPTWSRPGGIAATDRQAPTDDVAVYDFGRTFAQGLGKTVRSIEYWNEQNTNFFAGYPYEYANGLKAFTAGVKSVDPGIRVLIGAASGQPGDFFSEIYRNGVANSFDARNQHYYGTNADIQDFVNAQVREIEQIGGVEAHPGWLTEMGYSLRRDAAGSWRASEIEQAAYLVKTYVTGFAAGYERVFFFFWRELIEAELHTWGILHGDFSPRPAYLSLAVLTRHLANATLAATDANGDGRVIYFRKPAGDYVAVAWGVASIDRWANFEQIRDMFGRPIDKTNYNVAAGLPLLISKIDHLPASARTTAPQATYSRSANPLRISVKVLVAGRPVGAQSANHVAIRLGDGDLVEVAGLVYGTKADTDGEATKVNCTSGPGLTLVAATAQLPSTAGTGARPLFCRYRARLSPLGRSFIGAKVSQGGNEDTVQVALIPDAVRVEVASSRAMGSAGTCPTWSNRASRNVAVTISPNSATERRECPATNVVSRITQSGETWVFPAMATALGTMRGAMGLRFKFGTVAGLPRPPTPLLLQLVEKGGGIWLIELSSGGDGTYTGLFTLAKPAAWAKDTNKQLDLEDVKEIMVGWGGYGGDRGQQYGFSIESVSILTGGM